MLSNFAAAAVVVGLCAVQGVALFATATGATRVAAWAGLLCPLGILALCANRMALGVTGVSPRPIEILFLAGNLAAATLAVLLLWRAGAAPAWSGWGLWIVNAASCAVMVYLAFFFRLF